MGKKHKSKAHDIYRDLPPPLNKIMNELNPDPNLKPKLLTRPGAQSPDVAALSGLLDIMNNPLITGAEVPRGTDPKAALKNPPNVPPVPQVPEGVIDRGNVEYVPQPGEERLPGTPELRAGPPAPAPAPASNQKLYFTGRLKAGKDTSATAAGCRIFGFSEPLYAIAAHYFGRPFSGSEGKDLAGARAFLQAVGNIGRGDVTEAYPLTPARALLEDAIRTKGVYGEFGKLGVDWATFGRNQTIWLDACIARVDEYLAENPGARVAITNVRFENERVALKEAGWSGFHCMASSKTWADRLLKSKLTPQSPQVLDMSERLASQLDAGVIKEISTRKTGSKLRVIWSDDVVAPPSSRLLTVANFLQMLNVAPAPAPISTDDF